MYSGQSLLTCGTLSMQSNVFVVTLHFYAELTILAANIVTLDCSPWVVLGTTRQGML